MLSYCIFSYIQIGLGFGLTTLGNLLLLLLHHVNLHTIKEFREEPPKTRFAWISYSTFFRLLTLFLALTTLFSFPFTSNIYALHIRNIYSLVLSFILIPKYFINQNKNLKLYVEVYHWVPAPLLPWQLPKHFDPKSVKLVCVKYPNEE